MVTAYQIIKYEFDTQERLDHQLDKSLAIGIHQIWGVQGITVADVPPGTDLERRLETIVAAEKTVHIGLITRAQVKANQ